MENTPLPYTDAERAMFAALLWSGEPQRQILDSVAPADFGDAHLSRLWTWALSQPAETVTVTALAANCPYGVAWFASADEANPTHVLWTETAAEVRRAASVRALRRAAAEIVAEAGAPNAQPEPLADRWAEYLRNIARGGSSSGMHTIGELMPDVLAYIEAMRAGSAVTETIPTGYPLIDQASPLKAGELTILAARPSVGKSALALNMAVNMALAKSPAGFVSLEMTAGALARRVVQAHAQAAIRDARQPGSAYDRLIRSANVFRCAGLVISQPGRLTVSGLRRQCRQLVTQKGSKALFIDYLQLILPDTRLAQRNRENEVAEVSAAAKAIAMDCGVPVVMLAQLNRQAEGEKPKLSHLRDSGSIEQDADAVWLLDRDRNDTSGRTLLTIAKNREGEVGGQIPLIFRADCTLFMPGGDMCRNQRPPPAREVSDDDARWAMGDRE